MRDVGLGTWDEKFLRFSSYILRLTSFVIFLTSCQSAAQVCINNHCVEVQVVQKYDELMRGLQFRKSLPQNAGMLFVFSQSAVYPFWMKDTLIPLDMIWLDESKQVVHIERNVPPCRQDPCPVYTPSAKAFYVLEINGQCVEKLGIQAGNKAEFRIPGLK